MAESNDPPRPKKKRSEKRKRSAGSESEPKPKPKGTTEGKSERRTVDAQGRERPAFLVELPDDPDLNRLVAAYERGDYLLIRREAPRLADEAQRPAVRRAALELRRRIDPDPLARYLLFVAIGLLAFLVLWTYGLHSH